MLNAFGFLSTLVLYIIFSKLKSNKFFKKIPVILSVGTIIILILIIFKIDYKTYYSSARIFSFFITPVTIALAYPLYKNYNILTKNKRAIYPALVLGALGAAVSTYFLAVFFHVQRGIALSLVPKSATMPFALEISKILGGYSELTAVVVVLTGAFGGIFGHGILKLIKVKSDVAIGLALGSASHGIGTAACADKQKPKQIAASAVALVLFGLISVIICKILEKFIQ